MEIGIIGLPNAGKSTLFNALLKKQTALVANYPFATIEPNVGVVPVPDERLEILADIVAGGPHPRLPMPGTGGQADPLLTGEGMKNIPSKGGEQETPSDGGGRGWVRPPVVHATVKFVDIAGLVKGAAQGEGLGNKFLSHIREVDAICHVVRYFSDPNIIHVARLQSPEATADGGQAGASNPESDKDVIHTELILADLQTLEKQPAPKLSAAKKEDLLRHEAIQKLRKGLNEGKLAKDVSLTEEELEQVKQLQLLTMKPMFFVANVSEDQLQDSFESNTIPVCAKVEEELSQLSEDEQKEYLASLGLEKSGLERIIAKGYDMLNLISFLTAPSSAKASEGQGGYEVRAWTLRRGETALSASGVIHTDFMKKFIKAEVVAYDDFVLNNGWKGNREKGKARMEGKEYVIQDGDVVEFKIGS